MIRDALEAEIARFEGDARAASLALYLSAVLTWLSVQARDGVRRERLAMVRAEIVAGLTARASTTSAVSRKDVK